MIDVLQAFWDGFTRPRTVSLVGIFLVTAIQAALISPPILSRLNPGYLMAGRFDYNGYVCWSAMRLHRSRIDDTLVLHLGSSASREGVDDPDDVQEALSAAAGRPIRYWPLFLPGASFWDYGALLDQLPPDVHGFAIFEINPHFLAFTRDWTTRYRDESIAIDSPFLDSEYQRLFNRKRIRTGICLIDHAGFYSARRDNLWRCLLRRPIPYVAHRFECIPARPPVNENSLQDVANHFDERAPGSFEVLGRVVELAEAHGLKPILLQARPRPSSINLFPSLAASYERRLSDFCRDHHLPIVDPATAVRLTDDDYFDRYHLFTREARLRFQGEFVKEVSAAMTAEERPSHAR